MSDVWETKHGRRRVRRDPPTIEEAVTAAQGLTEELTEKIEIVASLMEVPIEEARSAVLHMGQSKDVNRVRSPPATGEPAPPALSWSSAARHAMPWCAPIGQPSA